MRLLIFLLFIMLIPNVAFAKSETIYASFKYTMGDNDSKNDARRFAFIEARKLAVEKVSSFIEGEPRVKDYSISQHEIKSYIGAIIDVQVDKEEFDSFSGSQILNMTVKAVIDIEPVITTLAIIRSDIALQKKVIKEQKQLKELEVKLNNIQKSISAETKSDRAIYLRKTRADILTNISENKSEIVSDIDKLDNSINMISDKVIKNVRNGMTLQELKDMLGKPRQSASYHKNNKSMLCQNYGKYWIIIDSSSVIGYISYYDYVGCNPNTLKQLIAFENLIK